MRVLGLSGSLRRGSRNTQLLREAAALAPAGTQITIYRGLGELPPYDADLDGQQPPAAADELRREIGTADALLVATPEYNGSIPGPLKNAVDWASRPFPDNALRNKPAAVIGASTGRFGGVWAQTEMRKVLSIAGARVLKDELAIPHAEKAFVADRLGDGQARRRLGELVERLVDEGGQRNLAAGSAAIP